mgnify:CR=1 FL=1
MITQLSTNSNELFAHESNTINATVRNNGTASAGRGEWRDKRQSMLDGFAHEGLKRGVPMIPKPKSEAWLICALKDQPYQNCGLLEDRSGNDNSPHSLKRELQALLGGEPATRKLLRDKIADGQINCLRIAMPSFQEFRERLEAVSAKE